MFEEMSPVFVPPAYRFTDCPGYCKFNQGVGCTEKTQCGHCGWNPIIAEKRLAKIKEARNER